MTERLKAIRTLSKGILDDLREIESLELENKVYKRTVDIHSECCSGNMDDSFIQKRLEWINDNDRKIDILKRCIKSAINIQQLLIDR